MLDTFSIKELLTAVIRRGKKVILCALVFAVLLGALQAVRLVSASGHNEATADREDVITVEDAVARYKSEKISLERQIDSAQSNLAAQQKYMNDSILMHLNPYDCFTTYIYLSVADIADSQGMALEFLTNKINNQYVLFWNGSDASACMDSAKLESVPSDTPDAYVHELVELIADENGLLTIAARSESEADSEYMANAVYNYLLENQSVIVDSSCPHNLVMISHCTSQMFDSGLNDLQKDALDNMTAYNSGISSLNKQLDELSMPSGVSTGRSLSSIVISVVKYMILGGMVGFVMACIVIWIVDVFRGTALSSYRIERASSAKCLGTLAVKKDLFSRWSDRILKERGLSTPEQARDYVIERIKLQLGDCKHILFTSTLDAAGVPDVLQGVMDQLKADGVAVDYMANFNHNPKAIRSLADCDGMILVESALGSTVPVINDMIALSEGVNKSVIGFILL